MENGILFTYIFFFNNYSWKCFCCWYTSYELSFSWTDFFDNSLWNWCRNCGFCWWKYRWNWNFCTCNHIDMNKWIKSFIFACSYNQMLRIVKMIIYQCRKLSIRKAIYILTVLLTVFKWRIPTFSRIVFNINKWHQGNDRNKSLPCRTIGKVRHQAASTNAPEAAWFLYKRIC